MALQLPFTPRAQPGESPLSVLRRGALGNGHHSTVRFAFSVNPTLDHSQTALGTLARNCDVFHDTCSGMGITEDEIGRVCYRRTGRGERDNLLWNGLTVSLEHLQFRRAKLCLACYLERGYALSEWDHVTTLACPKHRVLLDDACPCCGAPWTPGSDPLACGCSPDEMAARQQPCTERIATTMQRIIDAGDQEGLNTIGRLWRVVNLWLALGMPLTKSDVANALTELSLGNWPDLPCQDHGVLLHPRVALAPLLATPEPGCLKTAQGLLGKAMPVTHVSQLAEVRWSASNAQTVLGIGRMPFDKLIEAGHITAARDGRFSAVSINNLMWLVAGGNHFAQPMLPLEDLRSGRYRKSLASLISMIKAGDIVTYHCGLKGGLSDLHCALSEPQAPEITEGIGIREAATQLGTNEESVRRIIKLHLLSATKGSPKSTVQWLIQEPALKAFASTFVFASAIAKRHRTSVTTIASRLRSAGLVPVSGPGIDGGASFLFQRKDLVRIDLPTVLTASYRSPAGRRKRSPLTTSGASDQLTGTEVACELGISLREFREVVRSGWITPSAVVARRRVFSRDAVLSLKQRLENDFVLLREAARQLGQTEAQFRRTWASTGFVRCYSFPHHKLIQRQDLERILVIWNQAGSASSIGDDLKRRRWLCPNLTKMGQLSEVTRLGSGARKVRLYARSAPVLQHYALP